MTGQLFYSREPIWMKGLAQWFKEAVNARSNVIFDTFWKAATSSYDSTLKTLTALPVVKIELLSVTFNKKTTLL